MVKEQQQAAVKTVKSFCVDFGTFAKKYSVQFALSCSYATINNSSLQI